MSKLTRWAFSLLLAIQASAAGAVTGFKYISTPGDYIGQGQTEILLPPDTAITATGGIGLANVHVAPPGGWWYLDFASAQGEKLSRGGYPDATRYPFNSPMGPGLSVTGNGRGCNTSKGWFRVLEYAVDRAGVVSKLAIDFFQNCEVTGPPMYGSVRLNSSFPLVVPQTQAVAGSDFAVLAGRTAKLDGTQSFSRKYAPLTYKWSQLGGPAVSLGNESSATPAFIAPEVGLDGTTLRFRLETTDQSGATSRDDVIVLVESTSAPRTAVNFRGDPGDYITLGQTYRYDTHNATINFSRNFDGGVSASISGETWWSFDAATPSGTEFVPGVYLKAQRFPFQAPDVPGLSLSGDGRGCNTLKGKFVVHQAKFDSLGNPETLDLTFEQHCEGGKPAAYGQVLLNAVPHHILAAKLRAARKRYGD